MGVVIITIIILIALAAVAGPIIFLHSRRIFREQKNYERGLKMVPLLIHLPPPSEDIEGTGRDVRDIADENISRAQTIYNIIASTLQKGFKSKFYGQRHFAFEIVGYQGFVYFYAAVPIALVEVVKQAVISAYPSARLEEVAEHNIFSPVGKITGTIGGELTLKKEFAYPIATYQDSKRDAMQALLNALSSLEKEDGAGIQILMRPADPGWAKTATAVASKKRKGTDGKGGAEAVGGFLKNLAVAFSKPPESKEGEGGNKKELSGLEQSVVDAIDDKTRSPGYEVVIRVVVSSNISQRAQAILTNVVATFSLFDAPGKNGFKYIPAKDIDKFATAYIMRFFPQQKKKDILNAVELATLFHFPDQRNIPTSQLTRQDSRQVDAPRNMPEKGLLLGYNVFRGAKKPIRLDLQDRQRHMYVVGQTGTGKSTFLENLALQDMLNGDGFAFVDPHGDTAEKLLSMVPKERTEDVIYFSPAEMDYPMGLNLFEFHNAEQKDFLIQEALNMLYKLYDPQHQGIMGPRYEHLFRNAALTVMADPAGGTFVDIPKLFRDPKFVEQKLQHVTDQTVLEFWRKEMPASQRSNDFGEVVSWFVSKFGAFLSNEMMRNIIGQTKSAFDLRDIMDNKKILLVNLSKGRTGELNSKLLGMIFVMKFQAAAMSRADVPESERKDFALYVDEFQNFSTDSFATIMSEARKYHLNLIVANQFTTQLTPEIRDAVFGNMGTIVAFRIGQPDVEVITKYFQPTFEEEDLLRVPNFNTITRTLIGGVPTQPFSMSTLPPLGTSNPKLSAALKQLSAAKYGHPKSEVEADIFERMATKPTPPSASPLGGSASPFGASGAGVSPFGGAQPSFGAGAASPFGQPPAAGSLNPFGAPGANPPRAGGFAPAPSNPLASPNPFAAPAAAPSGTGNFMDEWLLKQRRTPATSPTSTSGIGAPTAMPAAPTGFAPAAPLPAPTAQPLIAPEPAASEEPKPSENALPALSHHSSAPLSAPSTDQQSEDMSDLGVTPEEPEDKPTSPAPEPKAPESEKPVSDKAEAPAEPKPDKKPHKAQKKLRDKLQKNISSDQIESQEVSEIAEQLTENLQPNETVTATEVPAETTSASEEPKVEAAPAAEVSGDAELPNLPIKAKTPEEMASEDTIVIDQDGNFTIKDEDQ